MKKLTTTLIILGLLWPGPAGAYTDQDITSLPPLGTPAQASDFLLTGDASQAAGSRFSQVLFSGVAGECLNGAASFIDVWTEAENTAAGYITSILGAGSGAVPYLYQSWAAFSGSDATPDVSGGQMFKTADTTTISDLDDGGDSSTLADGQHAYILCLHAAGFDFTGSGLSSMYGADYTCTVNQVMAFKYDLNQALWIWENPQGPVEALADPDADRLIGWDDSKGTGGAPELFAPDGTTIEISGTTLQVVGGAAAHLYHQTANFDPDNQYANYSGIIVLDPCTTAAITVTGISVYLNEDPTTELTVTCYFKTAAIGYSGGTQIDANDTDAGTFTATSFDVAAVPAGSKIWCQVGDDPDATTIGMELAITATYD